MNVIEHFIANLAGFVNMENDNSRSAILIQGDQKMASVV